MAKSKSKSPVGKKSIPEIVSDISPLNGITSIVEDDDKKFQAIKKVLDKETNIFRIEYLKLKNAAAELLNLYIKAGTLTRVHAIGAAINKLEELLGDRFDIYLNDEEDGEDELCLSFGPDDFERNLKKIFAKAKVENDDEEE